MIKARMTTQAQLISSYAAVGEAAPNMELIGMAQVETLTRIADELTRIADALETNSAIAPAGGHAIASLILRAEAHEERLDMHSILIEKLEELIALAGGHASGNLEAMQR